MRELAAITAEKVAVKKQLARAQIDLQDDPDSDKRKSTVTDLEQRLLALQVEYDTNKLTAKQKKAQIEAEADAEYRRQLTASTQEKILEYDVVQCVATKNYFVKIDGKYYDRDLTQIDREIFRFVNKAHQNDFHALLEQMGRNYLSYTYSFTNENSKIFNLAEGVRERWLKPVEYTGEIQDYQCPIGIDILFTSLSGGNQQVRDHIEEVVIRKYRNPGDYKIPNLFLFGEGAVGKNEFVTDFLGKIFVDSCAVTNFKTLTENAWSLVGKCCVLVDETISSKTDYDRFKSIAGNREFLVKKLYSDVVSIPNIMHLVVSGQGHDGPLSITDDATTRRFSAVYYTRHIFNWFADYLDWGEFNKETDEAQFKKEWDKIKEVDFTPEKISAWLGWVAAKFPVDQPVQAYHGEAYKRMVEAHKSPVDSLIDDVILLDYTGKPRAFAMDELYVLYKEFTRYYFAGRQPLGRNKFMQNISGLAASNKIPGWEYRDRQRWTKQGKRGDMPMLVPEGTQGSVERNYDPEVYMEIDAGRCVSFREWKGTNQNGDNPPTLVSNKLFTLKGR